MKPLDRWPNRNRLLEGAEVSMVWQLWFTALVTAVEGLQQHVQFGRGTPEGVVTAPQGTLFLRDDGGAATSLYVKTSGGTEPATLTNTGWTAK